MKLTIDGRHYEVELQQEAIIVGGTTYKVSVLREDEEILVKVAGRPFKVKIKDGQTVVVDGHEFKVEASGGSAISRPAPKPAPKTRASASKGAIRALMPGKVAALRVQEGDQVAEGTVLLILEAMKMQNEIRAPHPGIVKQVGVTPGQTVNNGDILVVVE